MLLTRIIVGVDGSHPAEVAAQAAIALAARMKAEVHLVSVIEELPRYTSAHEEMASEEAEARQYFMRMHQRVQQEAARQGLSIVSQVLIGHEVRQLLTYLTAAKADLLVIGHAGHSAVWGTGLGSTASQALRHAPCSVLIVRTHAPSIHFARLAVALDGSPLGWEAYATALEVARHTRTPLHVLSVAEGRFSASTAGLQAAVTEPSPSWLSFLLSAQARAAASAARAGVEVEITTKTGSASEMLTQAARDLDSDLLLVGATGHEHPWSQTVGSVSWKVAEEAHCSVLVVRPPRAGALVRDVMTPAPVVAHLETGLADILTALIEERTRLVPVISTDGILSGVITLSHLLRQLDPALAAHLAELQRPALIRTHLEQVIADRTARECMLSHPFFLQADVPLTVAGRYLTTHRITRVPVVDPSSHLLGLVSEHEIVSSLVTPLAHQPAFQGGTAVTADLTASQPLTAGMLADQSVPHLAESASADEVVTTLQATPGRVVLIVEENGQFRGLIDERVLLQRALVGKTRGLTGTLQRFLSLSQPHPSRHGQQQEPLTAASLLRPQIPILGTDLPLVQALGQVIASPNSDLGVVVTPDQRPVGVLWRGTALRALVRG